MKLFSILLLSLNFLLFVVGAFTLFTRPKEGGIERRKNSLFILLLMIGSILGLYFTDRPSQLQEILGVSSLVSSLSLFCWTAFQHRGKKLTPIHDSDIPTHLVQQGPYRYLRHPYYSAYLLSFLSGALLTNSIWLMLGVWGVSTIYARAADQEEQKFLLSPLSQIYREYKLHTGKFWPKIFFKNHVNKSKYPNSGIGESVPLP